MRGNTEAPLTHRTTHAHRAPNARRAPSAAHARRATHLGPAASARRATHLGRAAHARRATTGRRTSNARSATHARCATRRSVSARGAKIVGLPDFSDICGLVGDLDEISDVAARWGGAVAVQEAQHLGVGGQAGQGGEVAYLLPPRYWGLERRQLAQQRAIRIDQEQCHGSGHN
ncbi:hypothetical protein [Actinoplanes sp. NPDC048796]|uniref:hypothetical protein n=1 Tax=Actinoplanes sp. NPDC048796 TaxID=3155640 RepID=UPI0033CCF528